MKRCLLSLAFASVLFNSFAQDMNVHTQAGMDGIILSNAERWYLEEFDSLKRPIVGTLWEKGEVIGKTSWIYVDDTQQARIKIVSDPSGSTETRYDEKGNIINVVQTDDAGKETSLVKNEYNENNLLIETESTKEKLVTKTVYVYSEDEKIKVKKVFINGEISIMYEYESEEDWTETVYRKSIPILVQTWVGGVRKK